MDVIPDLPQGLNKTRVEALSDGVFSIAMTILVFDIKLPAGASGSGASDVMQALVHQWPYFLSYFVSFTVLGMYWTSHNAFFHFFSRTVTRLLIQLNMLYLVFIALIPFSAHFLGAYVSSPVAIVVYGLNIVAIGAVAFSMFAYALYSHDIDTSHIPSRVIKQARIRILLTPSFAILGMLSVYIHPGLSLLCFAFPVIFNIIPGTLDLTEKILGIELT
jgi:uncharacterized membrane protein